jgi:chaperonin cofactor prefoldin
MLREREDEVAQLKKKGEATASRIKILEADNQGLRKKIQALLTKTSAPVYAFVDVRFSDAPTKRP